MLKYKKDLSKRLKEIEQERIMFYGVNPITQPNLYIWLRDNITNGNLTRHLK